MSITKNEQENSSKRILFFIESLRSGGKERRLAELLIYLKHNTNYQLRLVLTEYEIHYEYVRDLDIPIDVIKRKYLKKDPSLFFRFYKIANKFKPDIIHAWGVMTTFFAVPTKILMRKPLLSNLIADAQNSNSKFSFSNLFRRSSFKYADMILGNSNAGFKAYGLENNKKKHLVYNGVHLERFDIHVDKKEIKSRFNIQTPYSVIMVASASIKKDYDLFLDVAKETLTQCGDVTFIGVGDGSEFERLNKRVADEKINNIRLIGRQTEVEKIIEISDIGVLFTYSEGISNSIIEYMALRKPVITTDIYGGSCEILEQEKSGFIVEKNIKTLTHKIIELLENPFLRNKLGEKGRKIIQEKFSIDKMGQAFVEIYESI